MIGISKCIQPHTYLPLHSQTTNMASHVLKKVKSTFAEMSSKGSKKPNDAMSKKSKDLHVGSRAVEFDPNWRPVDMHHIYKQYSKNLYKQQKKSPIGDNNKKSRQSCFGAMFVKTK
jgi:hypothetical protein